MSWTSSVHARLYADSTRDGMVWKSLVRPDALLAYVQSEYEYVVDVTRLGKLWRDGSVPRE